MGLRLLVEDIANDLLAERAIESATEVVDGARDLRGLEQLTPGRRTGSTAFPGEKMNQGNVGELHAPVPDDEAVAYAGWRMFLDRLKVPCREKLLGFTMQVGSSGAVPIREVHL
ncbi:hypothetical protein GCM10009422_22290 [Brevundimonas kwangchunensis]|uniref:Uncharacterized protein n=1 Tax=Brevundimonas kwangchunensis TaxID=322163 RepID=A0ABN1H0C1_9CAUL